MDPSPARPHGARLDAVDMLRGFAVLAVVSNHLWADFVSHGFDLGRHLPGYVSMPISSCGSLGIYVFFAISGFLITLTSLRRFGTLAAMRPGVFYRIRFARIAPLLVLLLAVLSVLHLAHVEAFYIKPSITTLPGAIFTSLTGNTGQLAQEKGAYLPPNWVILWSLAVEEMFYLAFPIACLALLRFRRGMFPFVLLLLALVVTGWYTRTYWNHDVSRTKAYLSSFDGIALGCLTALITDRLLRHGASGTFLKRGPLWVLGTAGVLGMLVLAEWPHWAWLPIPLRDSLMELGACLVMFATTLGRAQPGRWSLVPRWYGQYSYEIYMTHVFVVLLGVGLYSRHPTGFIAGWYLVVTLLTLPLGWLVATCFSEPMNARLRGPRPAPA